MSRSELEIADCMISKPWILKQIPNISLYKVSFSQSCLFHSTSEKFGFELGLVWIIFNYGFKKKTLITLENQVCKEVGPECTLLELINYITQPLKSVKLTTFLSGIPTKHLEEFRLNRNEFHVYIISLIGILVKSHTKVWSIKNKTNLNSIFCLVKSSKIGFIFSPVFYLIMWLMTLQKNFEKIAIL